MLSKINEPKINMLVYIKDKHKFGIITNIIGTNIVIDSRCCAPDEVIILGFVAIKATGENILLKRILNDVENQGISLNKKWNADGDRYYYSPFRDYWDINDVGNAGYFPVSEDEIYDTINHQSSLQENVPPNEELLCFIRNSIAKRNINKQNPIKDENRLQEQNSSVSGGGRPATARSLYTGDQITIARRHARNRAAIG